MRRLLLALLPTLYTLYFTLYTAPLAHAADYQQCSPSSTCVIGEFLYDDEYNPLTSATCTLTSKYPDNSSFLTSQDMTGGADGWYSYSASIGTTEGLYHSNICCTAGSDYLCIDKTFEVKSSSGSSLTASDVWSYSGRTLTSYGTLVSDIWNYSSRSLTSFGSLVADIWGYSSRTMTSFGSLVENIWGATPSNLSTSNPTSLESILSEQKTQRELLEKLVNAPVVVLELEDNNSRDLSLKLEESKKQAGLLYDSIQSTKSRLLSLDEKWGKLTQDAITKELSQLSQIWTSPAPLNTLIADWNVDTLSTLKANSEQVKSALAGLTTSALNSHTSLPPSNLLTSIESLTELENMLGDVTSTSGDSTFFGYLSSVTERDSLLQAESKKLASILEDWDGTGEIILKNRISDTQDRLLAINEYPSGESVITPSNPKASGKAALKNLVFSLQGLIGLNRNLLASSANSPVRGLWLEEGSIIFRAVITNPSKVVSQSAPLKFYLPKELKNSDIISLDDSLTASYDTIQEMIAINGTYELKPGSTKIVAVEVNDVWKLNDSELTALKQKTAELIKPLEKTNMYSQGLSLKSTIDSTLDQLIRFESTGIKPENRIRAYREAKLELAGVQANLTQLENLVAQAGANNSLIGFVGGVSTTAVFGIVLVIVAGFVFLSTYFKKLGKPISSELPQLTSLMDESSRGARPAWPMPLTIALVVIATAGSTIMLTRATPKPSISEVVVATPTATPTLSPVPSPSSDLSAIRNEVEDRSVLLQLTSVLVVPPDSSVNIRNAGNSDADIIMAIKESRDVIIFKTVGDWHQIGFTQSDKTKSYWVNKKFVESK